MGSPAARRVARHALGTALGVHVHLALACAQGLGNTQASGGVAQIEAGLLFSRGGMAVRAMVTTV